MPPVSGAIIPPAGDVLPPGLPELAGAPPRAAAFTPAVLESQFEAVSREVDALRGELDLVRRRDEALHLHLRRMDEEMRLAARLQRDFLPKEMPTLGRVRFHSLFRPAGYVSGDLYDVMRLDERHVGFYIADAIGHGVPAALLTMFVKHALQTKEITPGTKAYRLLDPAEALNRLNQRLVEQNLSHSTFATALYGTVDVETARVTLSRAGHPTPVVLRADGTVEMPEVEGSLLGVFPDETYSNLSIQLHPGDRLIVYTDGVDVAFATPAAVDADRWRQELLREPSMSAAEILAAFDRTLDAEAGSLRPKDDLTVLIVEVER